MPLNDVDKFLNEVCSQVKYKGAHIDINEELQNHIQDRIQDFIDIGIDEETAVKDAVSAMGNPIEIGKNLNRFHRPYLGWILSTVNVLIVIVGLFTALLVVPRIYSFYMIEKTFSEMPSSKDIKYSVNLNQKDRIDDRTVVLKKLIVDKNRSAYILFNDYSKPFLYGWGMLGFQVYDDKGNRYRRVTSSGIGNLFCTMHLIHIKNLNKDAKKIILNYDYYNRKMRFELPLSGGDNL